MAVTQVQDKNFIDHIKGKNAVIKFYADWCGSCKLFSPKYKRLSEDPRFTSISFLEINSEENPEARGAIGVNNLPYFAIFKEGKLVEGSTTSKEDAVVEMLNKLV